MAHKKKTAEEIKNEVKNAYVELENGLQELMTSEKYLDFLPVHIHCMSDNLFL